jgi:hypothetical protein
MFKMLIAVLIYHRHKNIDLIRYKLVGKGRFSNKKYLKEETGMKRYYF